jgi:hypothetical protein
VSYWASPEGDKKYDAETNQIMNSLAASYVAGYSVILRA